MCRDGADLYLLLGLIVAAIGLPFQMALQHPYVMIGLSIIFVLLALSMFGYLPYSFQAHYKTKLSLLSQQQKPVPLVEVLNGMIAGTCRFTFVHQHRFQGPCFMWRRVAIYSLVRLRFICSH